KTESDAAISRSFNILRTRIDKFGVSQPNIQQLGSGRILIELPGVKEPDRVRKLLQGTAKLEFWETWENKDIFNYLNSINDALKSSGKKDSLLAAMSGDSTAVSNDSTATTTTDSTLLALNPDSTVKDSSNALIDKIKKDS